VLGLRATIDRTIDILEVFSDYEIIVNQVKDIYQAKRKRIKKYRNEVWDLVDNCFLAFNISFVPREANQREDSLALFQHL
jgi:ribonuclease HI